MRFLRCDSPGHIDLSKLIRGSAAGIDSAKPMAENGRMPERGLLKKVDAVTVRVPDLESGLRFYADKLGHQLKWQNDHLGQAGLELPDGDSELVLTTEHSYEPNWLVESVDAALAAFVDNGGAIIAAPSDIPVGRVAVARDPFGNTLVLVDLSKGTYRTDDPGRVTDVA